MALTVNPAAQPEALRADEFRKISNRLWLILPIGLAGAAISLYSWDAMVLVVGLGCAAVFAHVYGSSFTVLLVSVVVYSLKSYTDRMSFGGLTLTEVCTLLVLALSAYYALAYWRTGTSQVWLLIAVAVSIVWFGISFLTRGLAFTVEGWISMAAPVGAVVVGVGLGLDLQRSSYKKFQSGVSVALVVVAGTAVINAVLALRQSFGGLSSSEVSRVSQSGSTYLVGVSERSIGALDSSQTLGLYLGIVSTFLLLAAWSYGRILRLFLLCAGMLTFAALFLSLMRGPMLASIFAIGLVLVRQASFIRGAFARVGVMLAVFAGCIGILAINGGYRWETAQKRILTVFSLDSDTSFLARQYETLPRALSIFKSNIFGLGPGGAGPVSVKYYADAPLGPITADNGYLNIGIQLGILGLIPLIVAMLFLTVRLIRGTDATANAAGGVLVFVLAVMVFGSYWNLTGPMVVAGFLVGLGVCRSRAGRQSLSHPLPNG